MAILKWTKLPKNEFKPRFAEVHKGVVCSQGPWRVFYVKLKKGGGRAFECYYGEEHIGTQYGLQEAKAICEKYIPKCKSKGIAKEIYNGYPDILLMLLKGE